jgi:hypothetical protein
VNLNPTGDLGLWPDASAWPAEWVLLFGSLHLPGLRNEYFCSVPASARPAEWVLLFGSCICRACGTSASVRFLHLLGPRNECFCSVPASTWPAEWVLLIGSCICLACGMSASDRFLLSPYVLLIATICHEGSAAGWPLLQTQRWQVTNHEKK